MDKNILEEILEVIINFEKANIKIDFYNFILK